MRPQVEQLRLQPDYATRFRWNMFMEGMPQIPSTPSLEKLNLQCISSTLPKKTGSTFDITIRGWTIPNPGIWKTSGTITLKFVETIDNLILDFFQRWHEACWNSVTGQGLTKAQLTALVRLERLTRLDVAVRQYKLFCFPSDYDNGGDLDEAGLALEPAITLAYANFEESAIGTGI